MPVLRDSQSRDCRSVFPVWQIHAGQANASAPAAEPSASGGGTDQLPQVSKAPPAHEQILRVLRGAAGSLNSRRTQIRGAEHGAHSAHARPVSGKNSAADPEACGASSPAAPAAKTCGR